MFHRVRRLPGIVAVLGLAPAFVAGADVILVPGDQPTVLDAIAAANSGDEIVVAAGVWTAASGYATSRRRAGRWCCSTRCRCRTR